MLGPLQEEVKERDVRIKDAQTMAIRAESQLSGLKTVLATKTSQCHRVENEVRGGGSRARAALCAAAEAGRSTCMPLLHMLLASQVPPGAAIPQGCLSGSNPVQRHTQPQPRCCTAQQRLHKP
jgi:hypothetical protein